MNHDFVIIDFETNHTIFPGMDPVECGLLHCSYDSFRILSTNNERFKPRTKIQKTVSRITGIYPQHVANRPYFQDSFPVLYSRHLQDVLFVGHNVCFDLKILGYFFTRIYRENFIVPYLDTLTLSRKYLPGLPNYKLGTIARSIHRYFNLPGHRAINDCLMCHHILSTIFSRENSMDFITEHIQTYKYEIPADIHTYIPVIIEKARQFFPVPVEEHHLSFYNNTPYLELISPSGKHLKTYRVEDFTSSSMQFRLIKTLRLFKA